MDPKQPGAPQRNMANAQLLCQVPLPEHRNWLKCDAAQSTDLFLYKTSTITYVSVRLSLQDIRRPMRSTSPYKCWITSTDPVSNLALSIPKTCASTSIPLTLHSLHSLHDSYSYPWISSGHGKMFFLNTYLSTCKQKPVPWTEAWERSFLLGNFIVFLRKSAKDNRTNMLKIQAHSNLSNQTQMKTAWSLRVQTQVSWPPCVLFSSFAVVVFFCPNTVPYLIFFHLMLLNSVLKNYSLPVTASFCLNTIQW